MRARTKKIGDRFGLLEIIGFCQSIKNHGVALVRCDCGKEKSVFLHNLRADEAGTTSCGCRRIERSRAASVTHGLTDSPEYVAWCKVKERCMTPGCKSYDRYGGRGIKMCDRWLHSFEMFLADMGKRPSSKHSVERVDNDGNYEPSNCIWGTPHQQARNRRSTVYVNVDGAKVSVAEAAELYGIPPLRIYRDVFRHGVSHEDAIARIREYHYVG